MILYWIRFISVKVVKMNVHENQKWRKERCSDWYDRIVLQTFTDEQWVENFRMTRQTFNKMCRVLEICIRE